jgi:hypothetical protein
VGANFWSRAGLGWRVRSRRPDVLVDTLLDAGGAELAWLVSQRDEPVRAEIETPGARALDDVETGERLCGEVDLPPYGVRVCRLVDR